ncbi:MAG: glycosyltransferase, partial [Deltaproteobacteria bacterium]|nr:glycosyltransferase [Deltaproteobacteria bacterium]
PSRHAIAAESARCFAAQTHPERELLVITDDADRLPQADRDALERVVREAAGERARFLHVRERVTLGALRNRSFAEAQGAFVCQWDDDDLSHPHRVRDQLAALGRVNGVASFLHEVVHVFPERGAAWVCNWRRAPQGGHPGTGLVRTGVRARYPEAGDDAVRGEDTTFALALRSEGAVAAPDTGPLYGYRFTGANTWAITHHESLVAQLALSKALLLRREAELRARLAELGLAQGTALHGSNGLAFVL